jgi:hypothetical protein
VVDVQLSQPEEKTVVEVHRLLIRLKFIILLLRRVASTPSTSRSFDRDCTLQIVKNEMWL